MGRGQPQTGETAGDATDETVGEVSEDVVEVTPLYPEGTLDPSTVTPDVAVSAFALNEACFAWIGKEVTVEGYYNSTTTSTTDYGTTIRIDLAHPDDTYTKYVGCEMLAALSPVSESLIVADRNGVQIRGTIVEESYGMVGMEGCTVLNR